MTSLALYRLPGHELATRIVSHQAPTACSSYAELAGLTGFVIAPFAITREEPALVIDPGEVTSFRPKAERRNLHAIDCTDATERERYAQNFATMHKKLVDGTFSKIVLARQKRIELQDEFQAIALFQKACTLYPRQMVMLTHTPTSGTWLTATPEVFLQGCDGRWRTMALAGTMLATSAPTPWDEKNIREQEVVARYIHTCLSAFSHDIEEHRPVTTQAGGLLHLKSEFEFSLNDHRQMGALLSALHPTPAVCGMPKDSALQLILDTERPPRSYYSGFMGPMGMGGATHLYVSLRCMRIAGPSCTLYAGSGLMRDSDPQSEWEETEGKLKTMLEVFQ